MKFYLVYPFKVSSTIFHISSSKSIHLIIIIQYSVHKSTITWIFVVADLVEVKINMSWSKYTYKLLNSDLTAEYLTTSFRKLLNNKILTKFWGKTNKEKKPHVLNAKLVLDTRPPSVLERKLRVLKCKIIYFTIISTNRQLSTTTGGIMDAQGMKTNLALNIGFPIHRNCIPDLPYWFHF